MKTRNKVYAFSIASLIILAMCGTTILIIKFFNWLLRHDTITVNGVYVLAILVFVYYFRMLYVIAKDELDNRTKDKTN